MIKEDKLLKIEAAVSKDELVPIQDNLHFPAILFPKVTSVRVQELCESRGGRSGLSVHMSLMVSVDVRQY